MLKIENLCVEIPGKEILKNVNLEVNAGETFVLFGPNGSGKTTLIMAIMGFSNYKVTSGRIIFKGEDITHLPVDERAKRGLGLMFQRPPTIKGVSLKQMVEVCSGKKDYAKEWVDQLNMESFLERDINYGFSGGEIKRSELLQLMAQGCDFVLLDEPESGVDLENICVMGKTINKLLQKDHHRRDRTKAGLIITHTGYILDYVEADRGCVLINGNFICRGNPRELLKDIHRSGYQECAVCRK
ncbi:MAG: ABC transporter ATP-binding protein [Candidatus Omnitrophica bacterium]|nr:ABC transporter ATP-binding protein [Candidatus Omnitrophota bacterium]MBU1924706.1 ABC transporter ATP-binding protein [Candidatus Omnitrophota bacterium]